MYPSLRTVIRQASRSNALVWFQNGPLVTTTTWEEPFSLRESWEILDVGGLTFLVCMAGIKRLNATRTLAYVLSRQLVHAHKY